ncbi:MAG: TVP38/TMEM64 family protein [Alphaproteobacteria bacterium]|nr:TVP38/TMEM64 family protein [Alphaproteobacteria bacterium]
MNIKTIKRWVPLIVLVMLMAVAFASGLHEKISLQVLQENKGAMLDVVASRPIVTALAFMAVYIVFVALSLPAATLLTLTGGFLFGPWLGTFYVVTAATIGATIIFFITKTSLGTTLREKAGGLYKRIEGNMNDNAAGYLLFMRLVPVFPFFLVNIVPALFNVKSRTYILTTFFGIIPGSFVYVNLGGQLAIIENLSDFVSVQTLLAFALLGVFALIPTLYKQFKGKKQIATALFAAALLITV